ncbi:antibiotic biosynthesis monooxygenase [Erwiniaceae bacterium BAC15a-03b]|uniref:Antibiotic biosynthesis monooxygenase n=1 Tax=Winslowiella arboricola TaxID=2978220 RepID=A0A9J6PVJ9_9GAMM|nr:putative quinol monooxygenase [Winslowiella arboricola]MCU5775622.1 antibiotic biosynthesis monooxygenase [Winslowiella arboricola]MCU5779528.1 antibiotic biosynthesis monooxygenase [Winslowiella arboricola]
MSSKSLMIVAKFVAQPGKADELKKVLNACVAPSRAEAGCIHYDLYRSVEDGNVFLFHETWQDEAAIALHNEQPHFKKLLAGSEGLIKQPPEVIIH